MLVGGRVYVAHCIEHGDRAISVAGGEQRPGLTLSSAGRDAGVLGVRRDRLISGRRSFGIVFQKLHALGAAPDCRISLGRGDEWRRSRVGQPTIAVEDHGAVASAAGHAFVKGLGGRLYSGNRVEPFDLLMPALVDPAVGDFELRLIRVGESLPHGEPLVLHRGAHHPHHAGRRHQDDQE